MKVLIVGAGATGLALGYLLARQRHEVTILEAGARAGGLLATFEIGGGRLEHFYHHFFTHDAEIRWLLRELNLEDRVLFRPTTMGVLRGGRIWPFDGPLDLLRFGAVGLSARVRFGLSSMALAGRAALAEREDEPAIGWFRRWAGKAATDAIWEPLLRCKFGDAAERVPLAWMAGRLRQRARSRSGGGERLGYLDGSLQVLVDRLLEELGRCGASIRLGTRVLRLLVRDGTVQGVRTPDGDIEADRVVCTIPTPLLADLTEEFSPEYARELRKIEYLAAICTILAVPKQLSPVYWLNVADPGYDFGGVIEQTNLIDPAAYGGMHILYLSRYLRTDNPLWSMDDATLLDREIGQLKRLFNGGPSVIAEHRIFRARYAAPLTDMGFHRKIPRHRSPLENLFVAAMPHIYPDERSVNNSIRVAAATLSAMGMNADEVPIGASLSGKYGG